MGFAFGGVSSKSMGITARVTNWVASPSLRNSYVTVPGKAGVTDFGGCSAERTITVKCNVLPKLYFTELVKILDDVAEWLNPEHGLKKLMLDDVPDRYFNARISDAVNCEKLILNAGAFDLNFVCPDPYAHAVYDDIFTISNVAKTILTRTKGNTSSLPLMYLKGSINGNNSITVTINGISQTVNGTLSNDETLVIDSEKMTAYVTDGSGNIIRNGLPMLSSLEFPALSAGLNEVNISVSNATFIQLKILSNSRWR
jgi:predicted phage tail component-like protein